MPDPGHFGPPGPRKSADEERRQVYPGYGAPGPRYPFQAGDRGQPGNPSAAALMDAMLDPASKAAFQAVLEECFRNFFGHTILPPWERPPWGAVRGAGRIIDKTSAATAIVATQNSWATPTDLVTGDVSAGEIAYLRWRGQGALEAAAWDYSYWRIVERGFQLTGAPALTTTNPIHPYDEWQHQMGQIESPDEIWVAVHGPKTWALQVRAFHIAGPTYHVMGRIKGWVVPMRVPGELTAGGTLTD